MPPKQAVMFWVVCGPCTWPSADLPVGVRPVEFKKACQHLPSLPQPRSRGLGEGVLRPECRAGTRGHKV